MTVCSKCGREMPEEALFCPGCGASALDYSVSQSDISPSNFNSGMTATSQPQTTGPAAQAQEVGFALPPAPSPEDKRRSSFSGRRGLVLAVIAILAVLLVGTTFESGMLGLGAPAVNSASNPFTGGQLYAAYAADQSSYANKTVYVRDSLDFGVSTDSTSGQYYSSIDSGNVILFWSSQSLPQLNAGTTVLAKCSVDGEQPSLGSGPLLILQDCALVSAQSQTSTTSANVSVNND